MCVICRSAFNELPFWLDTIIFQIMKNNKIWRVENMEFVHDDSEIKDSEIDESEIDDHEEDNE